HQDQRDSLDAAVREAYQRVEEEQPVLLALPGSEWEPEEYLALIEQLDDEWLDDFTRVRELLGIASGKDNAWHT
ncbi:hypothetical protein, partial [Klebsiella pneumoniae]|uniref:hypothetical protein n=1 Tax=Klebsiella pneumoniae TaxID=573 RepID=UPI001D0E7A15